MPTERCFQRGFSDSLYTPANNTSLWTIVLAGGEGTRMRPLIERWLGTFRPKQYCTFVGTRSMLQHTLDRATSLTEPDNVVTVIGNGHQSYFDEAVPFEIPGAVIEQPCNCGTAAGILMPLAYVLEHDPKATVLVLPSDHFVHPEKAFLRYANEAVQLADWLDDHIILLGAKSSRPETDYGWIEPGLERIGLPLDNGIHALEVARFHEKPNANEAELYYRRQWYWNTMIFAVKGQTLWNLACRLVPDVITKLQTLRAVLHAIMEERVPNEHLNLALEHLYTTMPMADFSRDILQKAVTSTILMPINRVHWCDWGRPERVSETLADLGTRPAFPMTMLGKIAEA